MKYLKIFTDFREAMEPLTNEEAGSLFRAMLLYAQTGEESALSGNERYLWTVARQHMDREAEAYETKKQTLRESGKKGAAARWSHTETKDGKSHPDHGNDGQDNDNDKYKNNDKDNDLSFLPENGPESVRSKKTVDSPAAEKRETHPSLEDIEKYVREAYLPVDAEHFFNYYTANGWIMGSQPMRDWKAALRAWARNAPVMARPPRPQPRSATDNFRAAMDILEAKRL